MNKLKINVIVIWFIQLNNPYPPPTYRKTLFYELTLTEIVWSISLK